MKNIQKPTQPISEEEIANSKTVLEAFFIHSLQEMYYAENLIAREFSVIEDQIISLNLKKILHNHYEILLKHKNRLEKIFQSINKPSASKNCNTFNALLNEGKGHLSMFEGDPANWEIALILVSQKLAHYKIASYGGLAHLAIKLSFYKAATLLAISAQEEEEFIANNLNGIIDAFLSSHVEGYKN